MVGGSRPHRWMVEAHSTAGFQETSLGQTQQRNPAKDEASLWAIFVAIPFGQAVRSVKGPEERSDKKRRTALDPAPGFGTVLVCLDNADVVIDGLDLVSKMVLWQPEEEKRGCRGRAVERT